MERVYTEVNNGVYRCGFAGSQEAYDGAYERLFDRAGLARRTGWPSRRYLIGDTITEADVRLFTTLVRFDAVYHGHFKCNRQKLTEMPVLWAYARDLFQTPGFGDTVDFDHIKRHYYEVHRTINPSGIVPRGPDLTELARAARTGGARRIAVRDRHAARAGPAGRDRATGPHAALLSSAAHQFRRGGAVAAREQQRGRQHQHAGGRDRGARAGERRPAAPHSAVSAATVALLLTDHAASVRATRSGSVCSSR